MESTVMDVAVKAKDVKSLVIAAAVVIGGGAILFLGVRAIRKAIAKNAKTKNEAPLNGESATEVKYEEVKETPAG